MTVDFFCQARSDGKSGRWETSGGPDSLADFGRWQQVTRWQTKLQHRVNILSLRNQLRLTRRPFHVTGKLGRKFCSVDMIAAAAE